MHSFNARLMLIALSFFTVVTLLIHAQPYSDHGIHEILVPEGCPAPCFMGIRPGITNADEAIRILQASDWVKQVDDHSLRNIGLVTWQWSNKKPYGFAGDSGFAIRRDFVDTLILRTDYPLGELRLALGLPSFEIIGRSQTQNIAHASYWGSYNRYGLVMLGSQPCTAIQPLLQKITITLGGTNVIPTRRFNSLSDMLRVC